MNDSQVSTIFLNTHPEIRALLGRVGPFSYSRGRTELLRVLIYSEGVLVYDSGEFDLSNLSSFQTHAFFHRLNKSLKILFIYSLVVRGRRHQVTIHVNPVKIHRHKSGRVSIRRHDLVARIPLTKQIARKRAIRAEKSARVPRSSVNSTRHSIRPNEQSYMPISETQETRQTNGDYSSSSSVRMVPWRSRASTSVITPGFAKLKPPQYPVNPHSVVIVDVEADGPVMSNQTGLSGNSGYYTTTVKAFTTDYTAPALPSHLPLARNKAIRKLIDKNELGIEGNIAQDLAQYGQTVELIATNVSKINRSIHNLRRGNIPEAVKILFSGGRTRLRGKGPAVERHLADNWLELQYGWKPLLQDIEGVLNSLSSLQAKPQGFVRKVAVSARCEQTDRSFFDPTDGGLSPLQGVHTVQTETRCRIGLRYKIDDPLKSFLAQTGFTNPIDLGWEILPFSFVADWFIPIGPYLETLSSWDGLVFLDGYQTQFTRQRVVSAVDASKISKFNSTIYCTTHGTYMRNTVMLDRIKLTAFPTQTFPVFKHGMQSITHALNGIALLISNFRR